MAKTKHLVITGITSGLGLALARLLLKNGHTVYGCGRRDDPLTPAEAEAFQGRYYFQQLDIMDFAACQSWAEKCQQSDAIDYLVHNAAAIHENANLWEMDREQMERVVDVNIKGSFNVLQAFLPGMLKQKQGVAITLSSGAGRMGIPKISGYCASKWAVEGMMKTLAEELPAPMAAIPMSPGIVDTDMLRTNFGEAAAQYQKPEDWATRAMPFILGLTREHNGESLTVPEV